MRSWLLLYFLLAYGLAISQHKLRSKADSLLDRLKVTSGIQRAEVLAKLSQLALPTYLDSAVNMIGKAASIYKSQENDTAVFVLYIDFVKALHQIGKSDIALQYAYKARRLEGDQVKTHHFQLMLNNELAEIHLHFRGNYDSALHYSKEALTFADDSLDQGIVLNRMGRSYNSLGMTVKALESYILALSLLEKNAKPSVVASVYLNMGILYEDDGNNSKAESYYKKASALYKQSGNIPGQFSLLNNLGIVYDHQHRYDESLAALAEAAKLLPLLPAEIEQGILDLNVGNTLAHMGRAKEAVTRFEKAMQIFIKIDDHYGITLCHRQLGEALNKINRFKEAEAEEYIALELAKKYGYTSLVVDAYHDLADIYGASHQFEKAYHYNRLYHHMDDSISNRDRASKLGLLDKEYEIAQRENDKQRLEKENDLHMAQARVDKVTRVGLASGLGIFVIASVAAFIAYNRTKSKNELLAKQKKEIEAANSVIVKQSEELQEAARTKSKFFANVSHELRTPVTLITGMLELMEKETPQNSHSKMSIALNNSRRLQTLIDEVLDLSRLEVDKVELRKRPREIALLLHRIVFSFDSLFESKKIKLVYDDAQLDGVWIDIDEDKFEKIINNLLYNAVKFSHDGGSIAVTGKLNAVKDKVIIQVTDTGIGIPESDIGHIFDRFYQSNFSKNKNSGGIGIGLSLVKEYTELHTGTVGVTSKENKGSTFELQFPLAKTISTEEYASIPEADELQISFSDLEKTPTILVAEDSKEMQYYLKEIFEENVKLVPSHNGKEALQWLSNNIPDLIISDVMMPEMDGYELLRQLKGSNTMRNIPVVMLTARGSEEDLLFGLTLGVDDYIIKPFHVKELKIRIHNLLLNQQIRRQWQQKPIEKEEEETASTTGNGEFIEVVEGYVKERIKDASLGIADLADHLAVSERQLYRKCGLLTGMTPAHLIKEIRLKFAYKMLIDGEVNKISDLAVKVGFDNSAYFSRQFFARFGRKPVDML